MCILNVNIMVKNAVWYVSGVQARINSLGLINFCRRLGIVQNPHNKKLFWKTYLLKDHIQYRMLNLHTCVIHVMIRFLFLLSIFICTLVGL